MESLLVSAHIIPAGPMLKPERLDGYNLKVWELLQSEVDLSITKNANMKNSFCDLAPWDYRLQIYTHQVCAMGCVFRPLIRFQKRATNLFARNKNMTRCAVYPPSTSFSSVETGLTFLVLYLLQPYLVVVYLFSTSQTTITSQDNIGVKIKPLIIITLHFNTTLM